MSVQFPRPIETGPRIYGLGMRQLVYLGVTLGFGGLFAMGVFTPGLPFPARAVVALLSITLGVALAFWKYRGKFLDEILLYALRHFLRPRARVWRKEGEEIEFVYEPLTFDEEAPVLSMGLRGEESVPVSVVVAMLNLIVLGLLVLATFYMRRDGLQDLSRWLRRGGL